MRLSALHLVPYGLHEVGLAHANAPVQEERVIGLRRALRNRLAGGMSELVSAANDESVEGVTRIQLRGAVPIKASLRGGKRRRWSRAGIHLNGCRESAVMADRGRGRIVFGCDELN